MNKQDLLYNLMELVVFILPIAGLIWKAAQQSGSIRQMNREIEDLKARVEKNEVQSVKDLAEIKNSITQINISQAEILTSLKFITDSITELKKEK